MRPKLRVVVDEDPPFVVRSNDAWSGWAIDLWTEVARRAGLEWEIVKEGSPDDVVTWLATGRADVGVGDMSVTKERASRIDFSHPFFHSGLRILVRSDRSGSLWQALSSLATPAHGQLALGVFALLAVMSGVVFVLARRHDKANFPEARAEGAVEALYIASGALLKGNLDRRLLPGIGGRILTITWMLFGTAVVAYVTAAVASVLTVQRINSEVQTIDDLAGKPVAAIGGTANVEWLNQRGVTVVEKPDVGTAVAALLARDVDAVVHDSPVLSYWVAEHPGSAVEIVGRSFDFKDYAFALAHQSPLRVRLNLALLDLEEAGFFNQLDRRWMGSVR